MDVLLLGTGSSDGVPNCWCTCETCAEARSTGAIRTNTSVLVDRRVLIDPGPESPRQAQRAGLDWTRLRRDMDDPAITRRIEANVALAQRLGVEGTPALVVGNTLVPGAVDLDELERLVREARARR